MPRLSFSLKYKLSFNTKKQFNEAVNNWMEGRKWSPQWCWMEFNSHVKNAYWNVNRTALIWQENVQNS